MHTFYPQYTQQNAQMHRLSIVWQRLPVELDELLEGGWGHAAIVGQTVDGQVDDHDEGDHGDQAGKHGERISGQWVREC